MWFTETPWPPFFICLILSVVFFGLWYVQGQGRQLVAAAALLLLGGAIIVVEQLIVTDSERIEASIYDMAKSFAAGDADGTLDHFSEQDTTDRELVRRAIGLVEIQGNIRVTDMTVEMSPSKTDATSTFRATADGTYQKQSFHIPTRWELSWHREGPDWKVTRVRRLRFLGDGEMGVFAPPE